MGAVIAAAWAAAHADRVGRLVLVAPGPLDGVPPGREAEAAQTYARIRARRTDPAAQLSELRRSSPRGLADSLLAALVEDERSWDPVALDAALDTVGAARSLDPLAAARVPVLVVPAIVIGSCPSSSPMWRGCRAPHSTSSTGSATSSRSRCPAGGGADRGLHRARPRGTGRRCARDSGGRCGIARRSRPARPQFGATTGRGRPVTWV